jgi:hypothetical protein
MAALCFKDLDDLFTIRTRPCPALSTVRNFEQYQIPSARRRPERLVRCLYRRKGTYLESVVSVKQKGFGIRQQPIWSVGQI